jgi:single-stranded-DNA-specific exonuclease
MPEKRWVAKPAPQPEIVENLAREIGLSPELAYLLALRDVKTFSEAKAFFRPTLDALHDPFLMKGMSEAVARIEGAMANGENILIYGDYDVDGTTAVSLMKSYLSTRYDRLDTYIPDRYTEGYGISFQGIDYAADNDITLIIALDCGIKAVDKVAYATEKNIDFIICDHHNAGPEVPAAVAVLDPKQPDCPYPYKELSGCGVGFKLCQALHQQAGGNFEDLIPLLDLLAISIGADIVPITGENRTLAFFGLEVLNKNPRPGIRALMAVAGKDTFTIGNVVFILGPRINAAGRIEHGKLAVELLTGADAEQLLEKASYIDDHNKTRKDLDRGITDQALQLIAAEGPEYRTTTVLYSPDWHKGVIGIVASRLIESYHRPTIVFTKSGDKLAGSARSVPGFDLYQALEQCTETLIQFGGHKYAAGMTLLEENFSAFRQQFENVVQQTIAPELLIPQVAFDMELKLADITEKFYRILKQFEPHGPGNLSPTFVTHNLKDTGWAKGVGQDEAHLKFVALEESTGTQLSGIAFGFGHLAEDLKSGHPFSIAYHVEENIWNGNVSLQLMVKDVKLSESVEF